MRRRRRDAQGMARQGSAVESSLASQLPIISVIIDHITATVDDSSSRWEWEQTEADGTVGREKDDQCGGYMIYW
jgi:hypothetical protein